VFYQADPVATLAGPLPGGRSSLHLLDLTKGEDKVVIDDLANFTVSGDGSRVLYATDTGEWRAEALARRDERIAQLEAELAALKTRLGERHEPSVIAMIFQRQGYKIQPHIRLRDICKGFLPSAGGGQKCVDLQGDVLVLEG